MPEDIIAAVTCLITETGESLQGSRGIARRMADAGLLVGTTPDAPDCDRVSNTVEVLVARLRKKLPEGAIETVRGLGYRMKATV